MKKTELMKKVEERIGEPIDVYLRREYVDERMSTVKIAERLSVGSTTIRDWLKKESIEIRDSSEATSIAQLPEGFVKPSKEELERMYVNEKMSIIKIGEKLGVSRAGVHNWLRENEIGIRDRPEAKLPNGVTKPTKEELEKLYYEDGLGMAKIGIRFGVSHFIVRGWLNDYDIEIREARKLPEGFVKPTRDELERMYVDEKMGTYKIAERLGANATSVFKWLRENGIETREPPRLPEGFVKPTRDELERFYVNERISVEKISKKLGVSHFTVCNWLREYDIEIRDSSEAKLPEGIIKPKKQELEIMYVNEKMSAEKMGKRLGVGTTTIYSWLRENEIEIRDISEAMSIAHLPDGFTKPNKEELERMYVRDGISTYKIGERLGVSNSTIINWLKKYKISTRSHNDMSNSQFKDFLRNSKTALDLAGAAILMNGAGNDIESIILEAYQGTFKDRKEFHSLLENNRQEIYNLIKEGLTNLGVYLADFSLDERAIIPVLIGQAISGISDEKVTSSLEDKVVRILRTQYSPLFNENMQGTLKTIEGRMTESEGKVKGIYQRLYNHYSETMKLMGELS